MSGRITSKSSNRLQIDTKHIWAQLIASKTKFPKSSASNRTTMALSAFERRSASREDCVKHETASRRFGQQAVAPAPRTAGEIMTTDVISVSIGASVRDVAILLLEKR